MSANKEGDAMFSDREKLVLGAIIDYYLTQGETVGSRTLVKKYSLDLSSATIRNVMSDLEEDGYISKTHTSSGRIPTSKGYKYYVQTLLKIKKLSEEEIKKINIAYEKKVTELEDMLHNTSTLLSKLTSYAGVVVEPDVKNERLKKIELVHINNYMVMAVIVMENGTVRNKKIHLENSISEEETKKLSKVLNKKMATHEIGTILSQIEDTVKEEQEENLDELVKECFGEIEGGLFVEGAPEIIELHGKDKPEDVTKMMKFFGTEKDVKCIFTEIAKQHSNKEGKVNVILGEELGVSGLEDLSFVYSSYNLGSSTGVIGVIGPKRMEYGKTVGLVEYVTKEVNKVIENIDKDKEE